ncbi:MAG: lysylphosphatidylglycerol synthase transmembrane domain-containing protein [Chloroflexota bacterium]
MLLYLSLRGVNFATTWEAIRGLTFQQIAILIVINLSVLTALYARWWVIVRGMGYAVPFRAISRYTLAGFAISYLTPGPQFGGEPVQILFLNRNHQVPVEEAIASVAVEKLLGLVTDIFFLTIGLLFLLQTELLPPNNQGVASLLILSTILLFVGMFGAWFRGYPFLTRLVGRFIRGQEQPSSFFASLTSTEGELITLCREKSNLLLFSIFFSIGSWLLFATEYLLTATFLGLPITPLTGILLISAFRLAFLMPVPGGIGTIEASQIWVLSGLGFAAATEIGFSLSLIIRVRDILIALVGLVFFYQLPKKKRDERQE